MVMSTIKIQKRKKCIKTYCTYRGRVDRRYYFFPIFPFLFSHYHDSFFFCFCSCLGAPFYCCAHFFYTYSDSYHSLSQIRSSESHPILVQNHRIHVHSMCCYFYSNPFICANDICVKVCVRVCVYVWNFGFVCLFIFFFLSSSRPVSLRFCGVDL